jgi:acetylornithine deacetylase
MMMDSYLTEVATRIVAFDTVSERSNIPAVEYLADHLEGHGFRVAVQRFDVAGVEKANLVASVGPARSGGLAIAGHVDVVPYESQPGWTRDPLRLEISGDRVYGRGTSDMKIFLAQCLAAAASLDRRSIRRPLSFFFTADEEIGSGGAALLAPELSDLLGDSPLPEFAWIGEPTSYEVFHAHKGLVRFRVIVRGRGGHSSRPYLGVNAIVVMAKLVEEIGHVQADLVIRRSAAHGEVFPEAPYTTLNVGTIAGGTATNVIAEEATCSVSYRPLPDMDPLGPYREIGERLRRLDLHDYGSSNLVASAQMTEPSVVPALSSPTGTALERELFRVLGRKSSAGAPFATDGPWLTQRGIVTLICGPGELDQAHQPNESIGRDAFENGTKVILAVVGALCC